MAQTRFTFRANARTFIASERHRFFNIPHSINIHSPKIKWPGLLSAATELPFHLVASNAWAVTRSRHRRLHTKKSDLAVQRRRAKEAARGATRGSPNFWPILARSRSSQCC
ncbi:hypothetical protein ES332_A03G145300v1 [Gossypium tomentosum]|uniref:Uncharacterized protein n=1 Tax=Gossypium tomentosum TaxID=34277 RepID=A0A5D2R6Z4_GOSTO|nr:hypothetical protein ES332_A03G145300v1 [Gossypium tomentosum]